MKRDIKAIVFDIDGTLIDGSIWNFLTIFLDGSWKDHLNVLKRIRSAEIKNDDGLEKIKQIWISSGKATKDRFEEAYKTIPFREGVEKTISILKNEYELCLVTGSMNKYSEIIAKRLGINHHYSNTSIEWDKKQALIGIKQDNRSQGEVKLEQLKHFCMKLGIKPSECVVVGDGENDTKIFDFTGNGIFIKSGIEVEDGSLENHAWKSIRHFSELEDGIKLQ